MKAAEKQYSGQTQSHDDIYQTGSQTKQVCDTEVVDHLISTSGPDEHTNPRSRRIVFQGSNHQPARQFCHLEEREKRMNVIENVIHVI